MSELPHIDLTAAPEALRQYAQDHFGKKISAQAKDETVVERFAQIYFEETGITLEGADPQGKKDAPPAKKDPDIKKEPTHATIIVQDDDKDPGAICGSVDFVPYRIVRNVEVKVSNKILNSLRTAMKTIYDPETMAPKDILAYPFSIVELHY